DVATGKELGTYLKGHPDPVAVLAFSADGKHLAAGCGHTAIVWDVQTGALWKAVVTRHNGSSHPDSRERDVVSALAFAPDGKSLFVCNHPHSWVFVGDLTAKDEVLRPDPRLKGLAEVFAEGTLQPEGLAFRPGGKELAIVSYIEPVNRGRGGISPLVVMDLT